MNRRIYQVLSLLGLLAGLALFVYLVEKTGVATILAAIRLMGVSLVLLLLLSGARQYLRTAAWYHSIEPEHREIGYFELFKIRLVGEAVTDLTVAGPFLGETVKALVVSRQLSVAHSLSSLFIENLLYSLSAALFVLAGIFLFVANFTLLEAMRLTVWLVGIIMALAVLGAYGVIRHRWLPLGKLMDWLRHSNRQWTWLERREEKIRLFEENVYGYFGRHRGLFFYIFGLELLTNFTGVLEAYLILYVTLGRGSLLAAFIIESVNRVVNTVFAFVPLRVGVEEGGAAVTLRALGFSFADGVSLSIIRKIRTFFWVAVGLAILAGKSLEEAKDSARGPLAVSPTRKRKRLIVNADDFGFTEGVNRAVIRGHDQGIITSASLMATGVAFDSAVRLARERPRLAVGVHLNLTAGKPVADPASIPTLVNERGLFASAPVTLARKIMLGHVRMEHMERELRAQIEKVLEAGLSASHLDGHKHIHALPVIWRLAIRLAREYGISRVRLPVESSVTLLPLLWRNRAASSRIVRQYLAAQALALVAWRARQEARGIGVACPESFYGVTATGFLDRSSLREILLSLRAGTSELMCHPGYADAELAASGTRLVVQRERELEALSSPETKALVADLGIELVSYREL